MSDPKKVVLGVVVLVVALVLIERWHLTDEERVDAAWLELCGAMQDEDAGRMRAVLHGDMTYDGPRPVGQGDHAAAMVALAGFWDQADRVAVITRKNEIQVQGHVATNLATLIWRFHWGDSAVIYRVRVQVAWAADGDSWRARDIDILDMTPGLFGQ